MVRIVLARVFLPMFALAVVMGATSARVSAAFDPNGGVGAGTVIARTPEQVTCLPGALNCDGVPAPLLGPSVSFACPNLGNGWSCTKVSKIPAGYAPASYWEARTWWPDCTWYFFRAVVWGCLGQTPTGVLSVMDRNGFETCKRSPLKQLPGVPGVAYADIGLFGESDWRDVDDLAVFLGSEGGCIQRIDWFGGCPGTCHTP